MSAPTIIQKMWFELDKYIELAMTWDGPSNNDEGDLIDQARIEWLDDKLQRTEKTAIGRGMAEAILIACAPFFENSDQVVKLAVKRFQAKKLGEEAPDTPGFMGQTTGEALHIAATGTVPGRPANTAKEKQPAKPVKASTPPAPKKSSPAPSGGNSAVEPIPELMAHAIIIAHKNGNFGAKQLAATFNVGEDQIRELLANA